MVRAKEQIVPGLPMKPGYYHVICDNSDRGAPDTVMIVEGERRRIHVRPPSRVFEKLAAGDMHDQRNVERFRAHPGGGARGQRPRAGREPRASASEHLSELVKAYTQTSVPGTGQAVDAEPGRAARPRGTQGEAMNLGCRPSAS